MNKKRLCGLDYCPQKGLIESYSTCTWDNDGESEEDRLREQCRAFIDIVNMMNGADNED